MKVARLYRFDDIRIEDMPVPEIGPMDALIKTKACGICSGDVMPWYIEKKAPLVPGHEPTGEIVEIGRGLSDISRQMPAFRAGDRVFVHHHAPCMDCRHCRNGDYVQCETWQNSRIIPGGISEYILVPGINLANDTLMLPDGISYEEGTLIEPAACVVKSLRRASVKKGATVLVIGLGVMGQLHVLLAKEFGAEKVIGADMISYRLERALEFGADYAVDVSREHLTERLRDLTNGFMADTVIVGPNSADAMQQGISAVSRAGTVVLFTPAKPGESLAISPNPLYFRDINIVTSYSCGPSDTRAALEFIKKGIVKADKLITGRFPVEKTAEAFAAAYQAGDSLKNIIVFN